MRLYVYRIDRDYGFAPNPFYGICTLATCKPSIRSAAEEGDWVIGLVGNGEGDRYKRKNLADRMLYAMRVDDDTGFDAYWRSAEYACKHAKPTGSWKQQYGDNIYHIENGSWIQDPSHHRQSNGEPSQKNIDRDTGRTCRPRLKRPARVLISREFVYLGCEAIELPGSLTPYAPTGENLCFSGRHHKSRFSENFVSATVEWLQELKRCNTWGCVGDPIELLLQREKESAA